MMILDAGRARCQSCGAVFRCGDWVPERCLHCHFEKKRVTYQFPFAVRVVQQATRQTTAPDRLPQPRFGEQNETAAGGG
jgi:hypothetical protein